jgi:probable F420-dependent oxidoreductase
MFSHVELGIVLRNMGPQSSRQLLCDCARAAEDCGLDSLWVVDHVAVPPDDAEGSQGRYLDPLATLAWIAGQTQRIGLGTGVLVLPYRRPLPTAKWIASVQELSGGRLRLGVGVGWMPAEFRALGVPRSRRGAETERSLAFLRRCFDAPGDLVEEKGQSFYFRPRPPRPPIFVGGAPRHAFPRVLRHADGWMPMGADPETLAPAIADLHRLAAEEGRPRPEVVVMGRLPVDDAERGRDAVARLAALGVTRIVHGARYEDAREFARAAESLAQLRSAG